MESIETIIPYAKYAPLDAIVLAGTDTNPRRLLKGENKAFLEIGGQALVQRVVTALSKASSIGQIFVVGPSDRLQRVLSDLPAQISVVEQTGKMVGNAWQAIYASGARFRDLHGRDDPHRPLLFISADLPLISAAAVDDFVRQMQVQQLTRQGLQAVRYATATMADAEGLVGHRRAVDIRIRADDDRGDR